MIEINLWLDSYDDIYSDFDSRHYLKRRISEDFLHELRTEMKYKEHHTGELVLLLPPETRNESSEKIIANSLTDFFISQFRFHQDKCRRKLNKGILLLVTGIIIMSLNSWLSYHSEVSYPIYGLKVLLEPAGWFLLWAALEFLFYDYTELKKERNFYRELSEMHIHFKAS
ncbi:MAG: hypothetical protein ACM3H8_02170 [Sphingobacteriales bacterium]